MNDSIPVLLDTDIGSDIDDAVALAYLLRHPRCELLGITTVTGDVARRADCAQVVCRAAGRTDLPIHCGASDVLLIGPGQPRCPQYAAIASLVEPRHWAANTAVDFLRQTIRARPGEITLLTIGPLTNIALLFALDPELPGMLKQVVSMVGSFFNPEREWNAKVDPIATGMFYQRWAPRHISFGLDVTRQCQLDAAEVRQRFRGPLLQVVAQMAEIWFKDAPRLTFHDPLAAACIFRPALCEYAHGQVTVSLGAEESACGQTRFVENAAGNPHTVARAVNAPAFFDEYFSVFK